MKDKISYEEYIIIENRIENNKHKRTLQAFVMITLLIIAGILITKKAFPNSLEDFVIFIIGAIILAVIDLFVHIFIFSLTFYKNIEDSYLLEEYKKRVK